MPIEAVKIPQNVYVEDRIVGPVTLRQLIILIFSGGISYAIMMAARNQMGETSIPVTILCWTPFMVGLVFSFVKIQGIGLMRFIFLMLERLEKPALRTWSPRRGISINFRYFSAAEEKKKNQVVLQPHREKLEELSAILDLGPLSAAQSPEEAPTIVPPPETVVPRPVDQSRVRAETKESTPLFDDISMPDDPALTDEPAQSPGQTLQDILPPSGAHA